MMKHKFLPLAILILSASILAGSFYIGYSVQIASERQMEQMVSSHKETGLISVEEAAQYLGITPKVFHRMIVKDNKEKEGLSSYNTYRFIPYIELDGGMRLFSRDELDKWIAYNMGRSLD